MSAVMIERVERASWGVITSMDEGIRQRCRTAPLEVRRNIDRRREARGLRPLWPRATRRARPRATLRSLIARHKAFLALARAK
jgi:hypothetical protein